MVINLMSIEITGTDIRKAQEACQEEKGYPFQCPIGQALIRMFPGYSVHVSSRNFGLVNKETGEESYGDFQKNAEKFADNWDRRSTRNDVKPGFVGLRCQFNPVPII